MDQGVEEFVNGAAQEGQGFCFYGAGLVAYGAYRALLAFCGICPQAFLVTWLAGNPAEIEGIPVRTLEGVPKDMPVVVAVLRMQQDVIAASLAEQGYSCVHVLSQQEEHRLMAGYFAGQSMFPLADDGKSDAMIDFGLYEVMNDRDKPLVTHPALRTFEHGIQAGAALTEKRIAPVIDSTGDHISEKNRQYCELTATYWVWKNTSHDWKGIEHYRRHLLVEPGMLGEDVDAVLPLPYLRYPNAMAELCRYVGEDVRAVLFRVLREVCPEECEIYRSVLDEPYFYPYNMVCARRDVFDQYASWLFSITMRMEELAVDAPELSSSRAFSYVGEMLTSIYFLAHRDRLRIRHAEREIYV